MGLVSVVRAQGLTDLLSHVPPIVGPTPYSPPGLWVPGGLGFPGAGGIYVDPVFGTTIQRVTSTATSGTGDSTVYNKNGWWNADGTRIVYEPGSNGSRVAIDTRTGATIRGLPWGGEPTFSPVDPDAWYYQTGTQLRRFSLSTGADTVAKDFGAAFAAWPALGGSVDCVDATGRYWVFNFGGTARVWDQQTDTLFSGSFPASFGGGYIGITARADGVFLTSGNTVTWRPLDLVNHTIGAAVTRTPDWNGGDHGDVVSASDGNSYFVGINCCMPGGWAVMAWNLTQGGPSRVLVTIGSGHNDEHLSGIPRGPWRDWIVIDLETNASGTTDLASWGPFHQEIFMVNVLSGAVRRLAHHRSQNATAQYTFEPRVSVNWDGTRVAYLSNYGILGGNYSDLWTVTIPGGVTPPPPGPTAPSSPGALTVR